MSASIPDAAPISSDEGYLVRLNAGRPVAPSLPRAQILTEGYREQLLAIPAPVFFTKELKLAQGGYLTPALPGLVDVLDDAYRKVSGKTLREVVGRG